MPGEYAHTPGAMVWSQSGSALRADRAQQGGSGGVGRAVAEAVEPKQSYRDDVAFFQLGGRAVGVGTSVESEKPNRALSFFRVLGACAGFVSPFTLRCERKVCLVPSAPCAGNANRAGRLPRRVLSALRDGRHAAAVAAAPWWVRIAAARA